jgi:carbon storage regulator
LVLSRSCGDKWEVDAMLVLTRKAGERITIGDQIVLVVSKVSGNRVTVGIEAPPGVRIVRGELQQQPAATQGVVSGRRAVDSNGTGGRPETTSSTAEPTEAAAGHSDGASGDAVAETSATTAQPRYLSEAATGLNSRLIGAA